MIIPTKSFHKPDVDASPAELDQFYHTVLSCVTDVERCLDILSFFCFSNIALLLDTAVQSISDLLCHDPIDLQISLDELEAVIDLPDVDFSDEHPDNMKRPFRRVPEKFKIFLIDRERAGQFYINPQEAYINLTQRYLLHLPSVFPRTQESSPSCRLLSCRLVVHTCINVVNPTHELWQDLFELDFHGYLHLFKQTGLSMWNVYNHASQLMKWFRHQECYGLDVRAFKGSLYRHHCKTWDKSLSSSFKDCWRDVSTVMIMSTLQHPIYLNASADDHENLQTILTFGVPGFELAQFNRQCLYNGFWMLGDRATSDSQFLPELAEYLGSPSRGGNTWDGGNKYLLMSQKILWFIFRHTVPSALQLEFHELPNELPKRFLGIPELPFPDILFGKWPTKPRTFLMAVRMLPFYLLRTPYHRPLARSLKHYTLDMHPSWKDKVEFDYAVKEYVCRKYRKPPRRKDVEKPNVMLKF